MNKSKLKVSIIALIVAIITMVSSVFAWFTITGSMLNEIVITVGTISSKVKLYKVDAFNNDGVFDLPFNQNEILSDIGEEKKIREDIGNMRPSEIFLYALEIENTGTFTANIDIFFSKIDVQHSSKKNVLAEAVSLNLINPNSATNETYTNLLYMPSYTDTIESGYTGQIESKAKQTIFFYFKFEKLESLKLLNPSYFNSFSDLNYYEDTSFLIPQFTVRLEQIENLA